MAFHAAAEQRKDIILHLYINPHQLCFEKVESLQHSKPLSSKMAPNYMQKLLHIRGRRHHRNGGSPTKEPPSPVQHCLSLSATLMEESISAAESIINRWDLKSSDHNTTTLVLDRDETRTFLRSVDSLQRAMVFFTSPECLESPGRRSQSLIHAQALMQTAMRRLEKEFYRMLSSNRDRLDPEVLLSVRSPRSSVSDPDSEDEIRTVRESIAEVEQASANAMSDLRSIAQAMISAGYGKECVKIYKIMRKSIVDEGLYRLGLEFLTPNQIQKLEWPVLDLKIRNWLAATGVAVRTLFAGERILCDHVFDGSGSIKESCFADITKDAAANFLGFAESVSKTKRSPDKLFRILDMHSSLLDLRMDLESVFSFDSTAAIRSQALTSLLKLAEAARETVSEFEAAIQRDGSKKTGVPGGGIHPLTRYAMTYVVFLSDYDAALGDVYAGIPIQMPHMPESLLDSSAIMSELASPTTIRLAWLVLVLLCKLDGKAEVYSSAALSYLFLANNLQYVVNKVKESRLGFLLGKDWVDRHSAKVRHYVARYERLGWARVMAAVPAPEMAAGSPQAALLAFNAGFEEAVRVQREWVVADPSMREEVRRSVAEMVVPAYRHFYELYRPILSGDVAVALRFAPEDVMGRVMLLFSGSDGSESGSGTGSGDYGSGFGHGSTTKSSWWPGSH